MSNSETQVSLPSIAILLVLGGLVVRYLFFNSSSSTSTSAQSGARDPAAAMRRREEAVAQLQQMFPQVDRRTLLWDLQRTGGNMAATAERVLAGRLDTVRLPLGTVVLCYV
jgi:coupling of ubiquitin conjugation to ER degradation protein 1